MAGLIVVVAILVAIGIITAGICFLSCCQTALERCSVQARTTSPGRVWLMLIPVFNIVYQFILVNHLARSLGNEFARRGITDENPAPGQALGMAACGLGVAAILPIPVLAQLLMIASLICRIVYWVKLAEYSRRIAEPVAGEPALFGTIG